MNEYLNDVMDYTREIPEDDRIDLIQYYEEYFWTLEKQSKIFMKNTVHRNNSH